MEPLLIAIKVDTLVSLAHLAPQPTTASSLSTVALAASTILFLSGLILIYWIHTQHHLDIIVAPAVHLPAHDLISICIPARNEKRNIAACVEAVLSQTYPHFELLVVDDHSSDGTTEILQTFQRRSKRLHLIHGAELPKGWAGKPFALHQAAAAAAGAWFCFVDADTLLSPGALSACYATAIETGADLFTVITQQIALTFWERAVLPLVMTALSVGFSPRKVNDPRRRDAIANGQFILIKRKVFDAIGGYERIKGLIAEDKAIAEQVKTNGYRLVVADGRRFVRTRMYTTLKEMWEGWTKNIYVGLRDQPHLLLLGALGVTLLMMAALALPLWPALGLWWYFHGGSWMGLTLVGQALVVWAAVLFARAAAASDLGIPRLYALTTPLGAGVFAAMMLVSAWKVLSGQGVTWRGRRYLAR